MTRDLFDTVSQKVDAFSTDQTVKWPMLRLRLSNLQDPNSMRALQQTCDDQERCTRRGMVAVGLLLTEGLKHWNEGQVVLGRNYFRACVELTPQLPAAWTLLGNAEAHKLVQRCYAFKHECRLNAGTTTLTLGAPAMIAYSRALQLQPESVALKKQVSRIKKFMKSRLEPRIFADEMEIVAAQLGAMQSSAIPWRLSNSNSTSGPASDFSVASGMSLLWASPVARVNLRDSTRGGVQAYDRMMNPVVHEVMAAFQTFKLDFLEKVRRGEETCGDGGPASKCTDGHVNEHFFREQMESINHMHRDGWPSLTQLPGYIRLKEQMTDGFKQFFRALGANPPLIDPDGFQVWFSVHYSNSAHIPHQHEEASASGVMYLDVPEGSGPISFFDPRWACTPAPLSPFFHFQERTAETVKKQEEGITPMLFTSTNLRGVAYQGGKHLVRRAQQLRG